MGSQDGTGKGSIKVGRNPKAGAIFDFRNLRPHWLTFSPDGRLLAVTLEKERHW